MDILNDIPEKMESSEPARYGLGLQHWALLVVAFVLGVVFVNTWDRVTSLLDLGPSAAVAAPVEKQ